MPHAERLVDARLDQRVPALAPHRLRQVTRDHGRDVVIRGLCAGRKQLAQGSGPLERVDYAFLVRTVLRQPFAVDAARVIEQHAAGDPLECVLIAKAKRGQVLQDRIVEADLAFIHQLHEQHRIGDLGNGADVHHRVDGYRIAGDAVA